VPARVAVAALAGSLAASPGRGASAPAPRAAPADTGVALAWSAARCAAPAGDADADGLDDACELALARAFAPELVVDRRDCLWAADTAGGRLGGGYLFVAQRQGARVRLAYLAAYYRDCGWSGAACALRAGACGAHAGDSELVVVDVVPDDARGRWRAEAVFLSAHCFGRSDGRCRWYRGRALDRFAWADAAPRGAPRVWVARGKHAHYPSRASCDAGHWLYDSCDGNREVARFPVRSAGQNAGSRARPLPAPDGCVRGGALPLGAGGASPATAPRADRRECVWDETRPFRGWQGDARGAGPTSYGVVLRRVAGL
jgi:hypothetical protein